jgi:CheY-like chemotaxis protein
MKRVLVIDDDPAIAQLVSAALSAVGVLHQLSYYQDGGQGRLAATQGQHDLVVLDLMMPVVGGIEALAAIRSGPRSALTPVVVLTGKDDAGTRRYVERMGITAYVPKPVSAQQLGELMCRALGEAPTRSRPPETISH